MRKGVIFLLFLFTAGLIVSCNPEDEYLRQVYPKDSRQFAIQRLIQLSNENKIVNKEKVAEKLLKLDKTPDIGIAIMAVGQINYPQAIPRIAEIADECLKTPSVRNLKTLESIGHSIGLMKDPAGIPILEKILNQVQTPEQIAEGMREKPESVAKSAAVMALAEMPNDAKRLVPVIIKTMQDKKEDFGTKYNIAGILGNFGDPQAVKPLVAALFYEEKGFSLFPQARKALIKLGKYSEKELLSAYEGKNPSVNELQDDNKYRATKAKCPMYLKKGTHELDAEAVKKAECAEHAQWEATIASIDTTTKLKTSIILADIRSKSAVDELIAELEAQLKKEEKQPFLTEHLSIQLAKMGDLKATDTLLKMVSSDFALKLAKSDDDSKEAKKQAQLAKRGQEVSIRMKGAEALGILGDAKALPYLLKAVEDKTISEYDVMNDIIYFYEPKIWAADAYSRIVTNKDDAANFVKIAQSFVDEGKKYIEKVETKAKEEILKKEKAEIKPEDLDKKVKAQSVMDPNYDSTGRSVALMEKFIKRMAAVEECGDNLDCYAGKLNDKEPAIVEKAVYTIAFNGGMDKYASQISAILLHKEPYVRNAIAIALLKTESKAYVEPLSKADKAEGDKVEYASAMKEYDAILSYLESLNK